jgi:hypothetical protein
MKNALFCGSDRRNWRWGVVGGGGVEVFAVVQCLFAQRGAFAQRTRDGIHRAAESLMAWATTSRPMRFFSANA